MGKKWTILNRNISANTDIDGKRFVIFERTINCRSFGYVRLPQLNTIFIFFLLVFPFFFLLRLSTFTPLNSLYSKFERLKMLERISVGLKLGVLG